MPNGRADPLHRPLGRVGGGLDVAAPDELGVGRPGEHRHPARPEQQPWNAAEPACRNRQPVDPVGKGRVDVRGVGVLTGGDDQRAGGIPPSQLRHPARDAAADRREVVGEQQVGRHGRNLAGDARGVPLGKSSPDAADIARRPGPNCSALSTARRPAWPMRGPAPARPAAERTAARTAPGVGGVHQQAGLAIAHGVGDAAVGAADNRNAAGRGLGQRDAESLDHQLVGPGKAEIERGAIVEGGQVAVGNTVRKRTRSATPSCRARRLEVGLLDAVNPTTA